MIYLGEAVKDCCGNDTTALEPSYQLLPFNFASLVALQVGNL